ncbi:hypothetical protein [Streptomyces sp. cg35]|uniref:hypothetical protein n=1 Tax=Streptomyces sp. cg35 TaxID=3421650 RepID=UPI003D182019
MSAQARQDDDAFTGGCVVAFVVFLEIGYALLAGFSLMLHGMARSSYDPKSGGPPPATDWTEVWWWGGGAAMTLLFGAALLWLRRPYAGAVQLFAAAWTVTLAVAAWQRAQT